jgi:hypothetical protein
MYRGVVERATCILERGYRAVSFTFQLLYSQEKRIWHPLDKKFHAPRASLDIVIIKIIGTEPSSPSLKPSTCLSYPDSHMT